MGIEVHLEADVEASLKQQARERNLDFDRILNETIRAGLSVRSPVARPRFELPAFHLGTDRVDLTKALALVTELEDAETIRGMRLGEDR